jgi:uncharacterized protein YbjT (DUF2867 family)/uncharacterized membrane protein
MKVLVLGGYGLIGEAVVDLLTGAGMHVTGLGRDTAAAKRRNPDIRWIKADLAQLGAPGDWAPLLAGMDAVVNAAGALQDGARDDVRAVQERAVLALIAAGEAAAISCFVQISATGASHSAPTAFFRTKAVADDALRASKLNWIVLRPGLVISPAAYGSTALVRALVAFPLVQPLVLSRRPVQTVAAADVAQAVHDALTGRLPPGTSVDLVEDQAHTLGKLVTAFRARLGYTPARIVALPAWLAHPVSALADALGWLGWRSPLRRTAMSAIAGGVTGDPEPYRALAGRGVRPLGQTLAALPSTVQERWFARLWLLKPVLLGTLALFWIASGVIGFVRFDAAVFVLRSHGVRFDLAHAAVLVGSVADIVLGLGILVRRFARPALLGMIAVTLFYLAAATVLAPVMWLDPLGSLVKTLPALVLALVGLAVLEER